MTSDEAHHPAASRRHRRLAQRSTRRRRWTLAGAGIIIAALLLVIGVARSGDDTDAAAPSAPPAVVEAPTTTAVAPTTTSTTAAPVVTAFQAIVDTVEILDVPGGTARWRLGNPGPFDGPLTLQATGAESEGMSEVIVPVKPNGTRGWVPTDDIVPLSPRTAIRIDLSDRTAHLFVDGAEVDTAPVAIGTPRTPTPEIFAVVDHIEQRRNPNGTYGSWLFGLNQHSEALDSFEGGRPAIAIHGTNQPDLIGSEVSNGCVRMRNEDIERFAELVEFGTPVLITA